MKYVLPLLFCMITLGFEPVNNSDKNKFLFFRNLAGEMDSCLLDSFTLLVYLKEPSCTGCKEQLAEYFESTNINCEKIIVVPFLRSAFYRKTEIARVQSIFTNIDNMVFSIASGDTLTIQIDDTIESINAGGYPKIATLSTLNSKLSINRFDYKWLFHGTLLNTQGLDSLFGN